MDNFSRKNATAVMFLGHFAVGLGAKSLAPRVSLGALFLAVQWVDLLWPTLLLAGLERVEIRPGITTVTPLDFVYYPITHSLLMAFVWALVLGGGYWLLRRYPAGAWVMGAGVISHWLLDLVVHRPDLPLAFGESTRLGLGLWNSLPGTIAVEGLLFVAGIWLYLRQTRASNRTGQWAFWGLIGFFTVIYVANLFGPPPPDVKAIAVGGHAQWLLVFWGFWIDRNRAVRE